MMTFSKFIFHDFKCLIQLVFSTINLTLIIDYRLCREFENCVDRFLGAVRGYSKSKENKTNTHYLKKHFLIFTRKTGL